MNTSKFFLSTLIAAAAMSANAWAEDSACGTLEWTTAPSTAGNFWSKGYGLTFNFTEEIFTTLDTNTSYVLAAYWGANHNDPDANALVLKYSSDVRGWVLQIGRGELTGGGYETAISANTNFEFFGSDYKTFNTSIKAGETYTLSVVGGNQSMTPTLSWEATETSSAGSETLDSYAGNMNGGDGKTQMKYALQSRFYNLWNGGESGGWSDASWNTGLATNQEFANGFDTHFNKSVTMTTDRDVRLDSLNVSGGSTLSLVAGKNENGEVVPGTVTLSSANSLTLGEGARLDLGSNVTLDLGEVQNGTLNANIVGSGTIVWGNTNKASGHGTMISLSADFTGTLDLSGCISTASSQLNLGGTSKIMSSKGAWFWGGHVSVSELCILGGRSQISNGSITTTLGTTVENATLSLASGGKEGVLRGKVTVNNGGILLMESGDVTGWNGGDKSLYELTINKGGELKVTEAQTFGGMSLTLNGGKITGSSTIDLFASENGTGKTTTITVGGGTGSTDIVKSEISAGLYLRQTDTVVSVARYGELAISGVIGNTRPNNSLGGNNALIKDGMGMLTLSGDNIYTGGTTISQGTLIAANANALGTGAVSVASGATLKLATAVTGVGAVTLAEGAKFAIDVTGMTSVSPTAEGESVMLTILSSTALNFNGESIESHFDLENSNLGNWANWNREWTYDNGSLNLTLTIPEPSTFGLLAGLGALTLVGTRRRRKKA